MSLRDGETIFVIAAIVAAAIRFFWISEDTHRAFRETYAMPWVVSFGIAYLVLALTYAIVVLVWPRAVMEWTVFSLMIKTGVAPLWYSYLAGMIPRSQKRKKEGVNRAWWVMLQTIVVLVLLELLSGFVGIPAYSPWDISMFLFCFAVGICVFSIYFRRMLSVPKLAVGFIPIVAPFVVIWFKGL